MDMSPEWNEEFKISFRAIHSKDCVYFQVYDGKKKGKKQSLGHVAIPLTEIPSCDWDVWVELTEVPQGKLHVKLRGLNFGKDVEDASSLCGNFVGLPTTYSKEPTSSLPTGPEHNVTVKVVRGINLISADANGLSDPYCYLQIGNNERFKTDVKKYTLDPVWNETFNLSFRGDPSHMQLLIECRDWDLIGSDPLGSCRIRLSDMPREQDWKVVIGLEDVPHGKIELVITALDFGYENKRCDPDVVEEYESAPSFVIGVNGRREEYFGETVSFHIKCQNL